MATVASLDIKSPDGKVIMTVPLDQQVTVCTGDSINFTVKFDGNPSADLLTVKRWINAR